MKNHIYLVFLLMLSLTCKGKSDDNEDLSMLLLGTSSDTAQVANLSILPDNTDIITSDTITLSTSTSGASIYYTTDGSIPSSASTSYAAGFHCTLSANYTVKALGKKDKYVDSSTLSKTYKCHECLLNSDCPVGKSCNIGTYNTCI